MNRQSIHQQIESLLKTINDQHTIIKGHAGSVPQVEIDFLLQNLRQLYEATLMLNHTNALSSLDEVKAAVTQKILAEKRAVELRSSGFEKQQKDETSMPEKVEVAAEPAAKEEMKVESVPSPITEPAKQSRTSATFDLNSSLYQEQNTLGKKFSNADTLHKKVAPPQSSKTLSERMHRNPIKDLRTAIGINEKFLFVTRLFKGNLQQYSEAIEQINSKNNFDAAKQFIDADLSQKYGWNANDEHVKNFIELVERRFI